MSKFPNPVKLPNQVEQARIDRQKQIVSSAQVGIAIRVGIILFELVGVLLFQSSALFMDAVSSLMDVMSTIFLIVCIRLAQRPPDEDHPFGHGRYEPLGGLLLGMVLLTMGGILGIQQASDFAPGAARQTIHSLAWIFPLIAMLLLEITYHLVVHTAKKQHSPALAADAMHYRIDGISSFFATVALLLASYFPEWSFTFDRFGAILIACFMIGMGLYACRDNFHQLMDKVPDDSFFAKVREAAKRVKGVKGTEKIRIQSYGPDAHVDIDIEVDPQLSVDIAHRLSQQVRAEIQKAWPAVRDVTVHVEPYYANDH